jgi:hypothetical protein
MQVFIAYNFSIVVFIFMPQTHMCLRAREPKTQDGRFSKGLVERKKYKIMIILFVCLFLTLSLFALVYK